MNEPEWPSLDFETNLPAAEPAESASGEAAAVAPKPAPAAPRTASAPRERLQHVVAEDASKLPLVPVGGVFEGQVAVQGQTRIEGTVRGTLRGTGRLELGPEARVEGHVECEEVSSEGAVLGPIAAHERVELLPGSILDGDLDTPRAKISEQATWNGKARVGSR